jgi:PII-like signaling protein
VERTDRLLSLSEDAPMVAVAAGDVRTIEGLAAEVRGIAGGGLLTVEGVEVPGLTITCTPTTSAAEVGVPVAGSPWDGGSDVVRATIWGARTGPNAPHLAAVDALRRHGAGSATVLLGVDGVLGGERRRARFVAANRGVPAITVAVGECGAIDAALAEVGDLADLVTIEAVERNSVIDRGKLHARITLLTSEIAQSGGHPRYLELIHELRRGGAAGATALRGVWGFRGGGAPHGDRVLALRRDLPLIVETVDTAERSARWLEAAEALASDGDVVCSQRGLRIFTLD